MLTFRAQPLSHVVNTCQFVAGGQLYSGNGDIGKAESAVAMLAVEVGVLVVILDMAVVAVAQFVAYAVAAILNDVYQVVLSE
jgi:hypothetical protein